MKWFKLRKPKNTHEQFGGRLMTVYKTAENARLRKDPVQVRVEHICGNLTHQTMFQVNGDFLVSMLDAYCELNREPLPDQETHEQFLSTVAEHIQAPGTKPPQSLIDRKPNGQA